MKVGKPTYDTVNKVYTCNITDGFRLTSVKERSETPTFTPPLESFERSEDLRKSICETLLQSTKGWFSKPLTPDWLLPRILFSIPTADLELFDGTLAWEPVRLVISKENFLFEFDIVLKEQAEHIVIAFEEEKEEDSIPLSSSEPLPIGPTRRQLQKQRVLYARQKAAKALFVAESLTHTYVKEYGDDTDWEVDSDSDSPSEETKPWTSKL